MSQAECFEGRQPTCTPCDDSRCRARDGKESHEEQKGTDERRSTEAHGPALRSSGTTPPPPGDAVPTLLFTSTTSTYQRLSSSPTRLRLPPPRLDAREAAAPSPQVANAQRDADALTPVSGETPDTPLETARNSTDLPAAPAVFYTALRRMPAGARAQSEVPAADAMCIAHEAAAREHWRLAAHGCFL